MTEPVALRARRGVWARGAIAAGIVALAHCGTSRSNDQSPDATPGASGDLDASNSGSGGGGGSGGSGSGGSGSGGTGASSGVGAPDGSQGGASSSGATAVDGGTGGGGSSSGASSGAGPTTTADGGVILPPRDSTDFSMDPGWQFIKQDVTGAQAATFDDSAWTTVSTPHTYNDVDSYRVLANNSSGDTGTYTGPAWYRKHFKIPTQYTAAKVILEFERIRQAAQFYINGTSVGLYEDGVTACGIDVGDVITTVAGYAPGPYPSPFAVSVIVPGPVPDVGVTVSHPVGLV